MYVYVCVYLCYFHYEKEAIRQLPLNRPMLRTIEQFNVLKTQLRYSDFNFLPNFPRGYIAIITKRRINIYACVYVVI